MKKILYLAIIGLLIVSNLYSKEFTTLELQNIVEDYYYQSNRSINLWEKGRSSVLLESNKTEDFYEWKNLIDENIETAWVEGCNGSGIGEYVCLNVLRLDEFDTLVGLNHEDGKFMINFSINNGFCKNENLFKKNNRVKKAIVTVYDIPITVNMNSIYIKGDCKKIHEEIIQLLDTSAQQNFKFEVQIPKNEECYSAMLLLKFEILDIYKGTDYDDTCISEIKVYGEYASEEM